MQVKEESLAIQLLPLQGLSVSTIYQNVWLRYASPNPSSHVHSTEIGRRSAREPVKDPLSHLPSSTFELTHVCFLGESQDAHEQVYGSGGYDNEAKFSHELIGGAAAFEGMKLFEDNQRKEGSSKSARQSIAWELSTNRLLLDPLSVVTH